MKEIVEFLAERGIVCRRLEAIAPRELGSRKRLGIYCGADRNENGCVVFVLVKKSRVLQKEAKELEELFRKLIGKAGGQIDQKYLLIDAPLCSKAAAKLEEMGWRIFRKG